MESLKHGINLLDYIFDRKRIGMRRNNVDRIEDEDEDVKKERARVSASSLDVKEEILNLFFLIFL